MAIDYEQKLVRFELPTWAGSVRRFALPVSELGHAISACGWGLCNQLPMDRADVREEVERLRRDGGADFPEDVGLWYEQFTVLERK